MSEQRAACAGQWELFDSTEAIDHARARALCATCPIIRDCADRLAASINATAKHGGGPSGTWAGRLLGDGKQPIRPGSRFPREHGTDRGYGQHRYHGERACADCLAAHAALQRARKAAA